MAKISIINTKQFMIMNKKMLSSLRRLCYVALFFCVCWIAVFCWRSYNSLFSTSGTHVFFNTEGSAYMVTVFVLHALLSLAVIALCVAFVVNVLRGINCGDLFPQANVVLLRFGAIIVFFYAFIQDNLSQAFLNPAEVASGAVRTQLVLTDTPLVLILLVLIFSQMYKIARELAVESELTV